MHRTNLAKLSAYLKNLPDDYDKFGMGDFIADENPESLHHYLTTANMPVASCGTAACAVGHGPAAGFPFPKQDKFFRYGEADWFKYSSLYFIDHSCDERAWEWCFGGGWADYDDTPKGAALRIDYLLTKGHPPSKFTWSLSDLSEFIELYNPDHEG